VAENVPKYVTSAATEAGVPEGSISDLLAGLQSGNLSSVSNLTPEMLEIATEAYKDGYSASFKVVYLTTIAFGVCAIIAALISPNLEKSFNNRVERKLQGVGVKKEKIEDTQDV
jgi:hypothetical protein